MRRGKDLETFMNELPHKHRIELATIIHTKMYSGIHFFKGRDKSFIAWVSTNLKALNIEEEKYIYSEGDEVIESKCNKVYISYI